jgi:hypothetical protein
VDDTHPPDDVSSATPPVLAHLLTPYGFRAAVHAYRAGGPGPKSVLLVIAENMGYFHNPETGEEWWECSVHQARVAVATEQGERTVRRHIADFVAAGVLEAEVLDRVKGRMVGNVYVMRYAQLARLGGVTPEAKMAAGPTGGHRRPPVEHESSQALLPERHEELAVASGGRRPPTPVRASSEPSSRRGTPNPIWDAVVEVCSLHTDRMTVSERAHVGKVVRELKSVNATPDDIRGFAQWWHREHRGARLTPPTLTKHWSARGSVSGVAADYNPATAWMYS